MGRIMERWEGARAKSNMHKQKKRPKLGRWKSEFSEENSESWGRQGMDCLGRMKNGLVIKK